MLQQGLSKPRTTVPGNTVSLIQIRPVAVPA
jgi:hypothetical protein